MGVRIHDKCLDAIWKGVMGSEFIQEVYGVDILLETRELMDYYNSENADR